MLEFLEPVTEIVSVIATKALPLLLAFALVAMPIGALALFVPWKLSIEERRSGAGALLALMFVSTLIGFSSAKKRYSIIGVIMPLLLSGFGALFMLGYVQGRIERSVMSLGLAGFAAAMFVGLVLGAHNRDANAPPPRPAEPTLAVALNQLASALIALAPARTEAVQQQQRTQQDSEAASTFGLEMNFGREGLGSFAAPCVCGAPRISILCDAFCQGALAGGTQRPPQGGPFTGIFSLPSDTWLRYQSQTPGIDLLQLIAPGNRLGTD
jgi:hypothetical protein